MSTTYVFAISPPPAILVEQEVIIIGARAIARQSICAVKRLDLLVMGQARPFLSSIMCF